ncbi:uncharacterized protein LOC120337874 [Styela clava]
MAPNNSVFTSWQSLMLVCIIFINLNCTEQCDMKKVDGKRLANFRTRYGCTELYLRNITDGFSHHQINLVKCDRAFHVPWSNRMLLSEFECAKCPKFCHHPSNKTQLNREKYKSEAIRAKRIFDIKGEIQQRQYWWVPLSCRCVAKHHNRNVKIRKHCN